jgi:hypothetical protein
MNNPISRYLYDIWWVLKHIPQDTKRYITKPNAYNKSEMMYNFKKLPSEIFWPLKCFWYGIVNLYRWFPTIWFQRDYDQHFIYTVLEKKLELHEKFFMSDKPHILHAKRYARQMRVCKTLLGMVQDSPWHDNYTKFIEEHGDRTMKSSPCKFDEYGDPILYQLDHTYEKCNISKEEYDKVLLEALERDHAKEEKYNKALWRIMGKYVRHWWD